MFLFLQSIGSMFYPKIQSGILEIQFWILLPKKLENSLWQGVLASNKTFLLVNKQKKCWNARGNMGKLLKI